MSQRRVAKISSFLGFSAGSLPFSYLGVPLFKGKPKSVHLQPIVDRIKGKLSSWKGTLLSIMGRVQLLAYSFHIFMWPVSLLKQLDNWIQNFIWSGDIHKRNYVTVAWKLVCSPIVDGGLGIRSIRDINEASMLKLCWDMLSSSEQRTRFLKARFLRNSKPVSHHVNSSLWPALRNWYNVALLG